LSQRETTIDLSAIQALISSQKFEQALQQLSAHLADHPNDVEALYLLAVCHRYNNDNTQAQAALNRMIALAPDHGRAHQEQGHLLLANKQHELAAYAFARACRYNPALVASWQAQAELFSSLGNTGAAAQAQAQLARLQAMPKHLIAATDLIAQGKLVKAEKLCRQFLQKNPRHVEGMRLLADAGKRLGALDEAEFLLESAILLEPNNEHVHKDYIEVLRKRQRFPQALSEAKKLLTQAPDNPQYQSIYAIELMQTGDYEQALEYFDSVLKILPNDPVTLTSKGHALKTLGSHALAVAAYTAALSARPAHSEAYYSLANLKTYQFSDGELRRMLQQEGNPEHSPMERVYLYFALGKAYEDAEEFEKSFTYYEQGNDLKRSSSTYDAAKMTIELKAQHRVCTTALFSSHKDHGNPAADPIFIVGLPRSGSTMLEQILSSHSQVDGTLELPNILAMAQTLRRQGQAAATGTKKEKQTYPDVLAFLNADELAELGTQFMNDTAIHRKEAPFFIDKMPNNFRHIGLIKLILPNAKIIDARRHPMACCFSNFKQLFAEGQEFSYNFDDLAQYYRDYVNLMAHWDDALQGQVLRVHYEHVIDDLEGQVRRVLDFCGLPFENACLSFHETQRAVRTASSEQVRQPIYTGGLDQWRNYAAQLTALEHSLGDVIANYPSKT